MLSDAIPGKTRINWAVNCWQKWPDKIGWHSDIIFIEPLIKLFIEEAESDPEYILTKFDEIDDRKIRHSIFGKDSSDDFLKFARHVKRQRVALLALGLERCLFHGRLQIGGITPSEEILRGLSNELFLLLENKEVSLSTDYNEYLYETSV